MINWDTLCQPKARGGLGLKKFSFVNQAMISKQYWRVQNYPNSLMAKTFKAKYFPNSSLQNYKPKPHHSWTWRNIATSHHSTLLQGRWFVGNGHLIPLTHPDWFHCQQQTLADNHLLDGTVANLIDSNSRTSRFDLVKKLYPFPVCMEICQLPLPRIDGNQDRLFKHSESGEYKVKKAYQIIQQSACSSVISSERPFGIPHHRWKIIWKVKLPMKILNFIWKLLQDSLPVLSVLNNRGIVTPTCCLMCDQDDETINYLFLLCSFFRAVRHGSNLAIRTSSSTDISIKQWIVGYLSSTYSWE